jgi:hypothetical protein
MRQRMAACERLTIPTAMLMMAYIQKELDERKSLATGASVPMALEEA